MVQIDLDSRYEQYLKEQVEAGLFSSVNAAAEHAIDAQMAAQERASYIKKALAKGEQDIAEGKTVPFTADIISEISKKGKKQALAGKFVKHGVMP